LVSAIGALVEGGTEDGRYAAVKGVPVWVFIVGRCVVGVGGAAAVLLAALSVNKFTGSSDVDLLALTTLCFVAGSIGYRLLPIVAAQLEKRLGEVEKKADRAVKAAKEGADLASVTSSVLVALQVLDRSEELNAVVDRTIGDLEKLSLQFPQERALHIVLGRLYAEKKHDYDKAIAVLRKFITKKGKTKDKDVSDALFNVACYLSLKLAEATDEPTIRDLRAEGARALAECLAILPGSLQDAKDDPELAALRDTAEGQRILSVS
jgi:ribosomal protein S18